ncbi:DUF559 domain-containing protein [Rhodococcus zopfii]|uniref:DUF559 domain-containing protein n=1 Tax=Rhodococcus zopfii TaxID=43772 RepID=A0ABU3WUG7_9NOCA|nr:DUF559 domain-containing protein [Rhodococcus zopfii]
MDRSEIHAIMARQDGVVTRAQALENGMSPSMVSRLLATGEWATLDTGVYLRADRERTDAVLLRAAVYGAGSEAVAWGPSAAWWHGILEHPPARHYVTVPKHRTRPRDRDIRLRRRDLHWKDVVLVRGLYVTALPLTVLEAAVEIPDGSVLMDRALQRHTSLEILRQVHRRNSRRHGARSAALLLCSAGEGGHSEAERTLHRLLRDAGLAGWRAHVWSCGFEIDVAFETQRLAIEVDGWAWHRDAHRHRRDTERQNVLVNAGWHVLRFTWHSLTRDPDGVVRQIRAALRQRG